MPVAVGRKMQIRCGRAETLSWLGGQYRLCHGSRPFVRRLPARTAVDATKAVYMCHISRGVSPCVACAREDTYPGRAPFRWSLGLETVQRDVCYYSVSGLVSRGQSLCETERREPPGPFPTNCGDRRGQSAERGGGSGRYGLLVRIVGVSWLMLETDVATLGTRQGGIMPRACHRASRRQGARDRVGDLHRL